MLPFASFVLQGQFSSFSSISMGSFGIKKGYVEMKKINNGNDFHHCMLHDYCPNIMKL